MKWLAGFLKMVGRRQDFKTLYIQIKKYYKSASSSKPWEAKISFFPSVNMYNVYND